MTDSKSLVRISNVVKHFDISGGFLDRISFSGGRPSLTTTTVKALNDVSLDITQGEILSVVGESGCGKSTLGRTVLGLYPPTSGEIAFRDTRIDNLSARQMLPYRRKMQMVFQDPYASLNPRMTVRQILEEPTSFHFPDLSRSQVQDKVAEVMRQVGVDPAWAGRYPHEFSGGQRQRISIARALMVDPEFIVADEPISALDVSIQAQILNLIMDCQERFGLTYMFITHDLSVVEHISTRVAVMYLGTLCELADKKNLYGEPQHPYSRALLSAIPRLGSKGFSHMRLKGEVPTPINLPPGCVFHTRCPFTEERCRREIPALRTLPNGSRAACHALEEGRI
ncbi:MAG: ATP-binding cassette domain-containing protein [Desulfomicrobium sp.]|nr:ATP-binding cassette domain-containing protein [Pseudomonadota bacterium]MBV1713576.1 ATP-binding cassette domain-containing protein [Desulfomicrobium sp.]MBU4572112.1 ATP-binding cassette domain-containing protein [Pseudomonadota bacterium]MBU4594090.1 ATP-binding cassette domain-containing protein [Pseudomonadota bacterium]MBV1720959.1 ATP-binding cassette domain-containing protein [Desulfomicrobium sp.]